MWIKATGYDKEMLINMNNVTTVEERDRDGETALKVYFIGGGATMLPMTLEAMEKKILLSESFREIRL